MNMCLDASPSSAFSGSAGAGSVSFIRKSYKIAEDFRMII